MADNVNSIEEVFFAETIVDSGFGQQDGKRYYKVKWVQYSWENEANIPHLKDLIDLFWTEHRQINSIKVVETNFSKHVSDIEKSEVLQPKEVTISKFDEAVTNAVRPSQINPDHTNINNFEVDKNADDDLKEKKEKETDEANVKEIETVHVITTSSPCDVINDVIAMKPIECMPVDTKHECDVCYRKFDNQQSLKAHKRTHVADKVFQCTTCLKCFGERSTLKRHMYIHLEEKPFKCEHCDRAFSDKSTLRRHTITHTGDKRFECNICKKRFTRNEHLRQHMYIHTSEKLYKCDTCHKNFRQRSTLKNHMLLHRMVFKCERCGVSFLKQSVYEKHVLWCHTTQSVIKQYKCEFCETYFADSAELKSHEQLHNGDRPYNCTECNQSFSYKSILKRHMLTHVEKRKFICYACSKDFSKKPDLVRHISNTHANIPVTEFLKLTNQQPNPVPFSNDIKYIIQNIDLLNGLQVATSNINGLVVSTVPVLSAPVPAITAVSDSHIKAVSDSQIASNIAPTVIGGNESIAANTISEPTLPFQLNPAPQLPLEETTRSEETALQPGDDRLIEVQIVRMKNGEQIIQSIHPMLTTEQSTETGSLNTDIGETATLSTPTAENNIVNESSLNDGVNLMQTEQIV